MSYGGNINDSHTRPDGAAGPGGFFPSSGPTNQDGPPLLHCDVSFHNPAGMVRGTRWWRTVSDLTRQVQSPVTDRRLPRDRSPMCATACAARATSECTSAGALTRCLGSAAYFGSAGLRKPQITSSPCLTQAWPSVAPTDPAPMMAMRADNAWKTRRHSCATLHRSYVNSVCGRYSAIADNGQPERTKCVRMSLTLAQPCRSSCREWAPTSLADNKCVTCFQALIACSISQEPPDSNDIPYAVPKGCLAAHADCTTNCRRQTAPTSETPNANAENPK